MSIGERIARMVAPEAVSLTGEHVKRLRIAYEDIKRRCDYLERENKRLRKQMARLRNSSSNGRVPD